MRSPPPRFRDLLRDARLRLGFSQTRCDTEAAEEMGRRYCPGRWKALERNTGLPSDPREYRAACAVVGLDTAATLRRLGYIAADDWR